MFNNLKTTEKSYFHTFRRLTIHKFINNWNFHTNNDPAHKQIHKFFLNVDTKFKQFILSVSNQFFFFKMSLFYLGLNLKNTGIFSKGLRTPWFGIAVMREVMTLVLPWAPSPPVIWSARATSVLRVKSTPWRSPNFSLPLYHCNILYGSIQLNPCGLTFTHSNYLIVKYQNGFHFSVYFFFTLSHKSVPTFRKLKN